MFRHSFPRLSLFAVCFLVAVSASAFAQDFGDVPLSFEPNVGQSDTQVKFLSHGKGYGFFLTDEAAKLELGLTNPRNIELKVSNGQKPTAIAGENRLPGHVNYLRGERSQWRRGIPTFSRVRMRDVYPNVDLVYYGNHRQLEYDFVVHPSADASQVGLTTSGIDRIKLSEDGALTMLAGNAELHWHAPVAYQEIDGERRAVWARYAIAGNTISFDLGRYDHDRDLVIDPVMVYSTYIGGNGGDIGDTGNAIAVDAAGNAYVAGVAASTNFPTTSRAMQPADHGNDDAFVAKLNATGTAYIYSTYLGGGGQDLAYGIAVDASGNAYVTGQTGSGLYGTSAFPTTASAYQRSPNPATMNNSVFVSKISPDGNDLLYSTYLSGTNDSFSNGIAVDGSGNAYVLTSTAGGFPVTSGAYQKLAGTHNCPYEQFANGQAQVVTKLNPTGTALAYSTYIGHGCDYGSAIAVTAGGQATIAGYTQDKAYPVTSGAVQAKFGGVVDAFVTRLNASGSGLAFSTFLGGSLADFANGVAVDASGNTYVAGSTDGNFRTTSGAYKTAATNNAYRKGFVTKLSQQGKTLVYSTYVTGASNVSFSSIAVDKSGSANVTGWTDGKQYPITSNADQTSCYPASSGCLTQAVVTRLNANGTALVYSSYFGASDAHNNYFPGNMGTGIAVDNAGGFYITGRTSAGLKTSSAAVEAQYRSTSNSSNGFVAKFKAGGTTSGTKVSISTPVSGSTIGLIAKVTASATGNVAWMQIYVNGVKTVQFAGSTVNTALALLPGAQRITVQAVDKDGSLAKSTVNVTAK